MRMLNNLKGVYLRTGDYLRDARVIERLRQLSPDDVLQRRDLGPRCSRRGRRDEPSIICRRICRFRRKRPMSRRCSKC
jgi:hypothetical protein